MLAIPEDWMLIVHTEGGKFATDESGGLVVYDAAIHETNELGVPESERPTRFNNRVGRTLLYWVGSNSQARLNLAIQPVTLRK